MNEKRSPYSLHNIQMPAGCAEHRWSQKGMGKSGGAGVIYYNRFDRGEIWLLTLYAKSEHPTIPAHVLKLIKEVIDRG